MKGPSPHLSWDELACRNDERTSYPERWRATRAIDLAVVFETIRLRAGGGPIVVLSGYRTKLHNKRIGGARFSQHLEGRALDLRPPKRMSIDDFYALINDLATDLPIRGIGKYRTFVHVDIRPGAHIARWTGTGIKDGP